MSTTNGLLLLDKTRGRTSHDVVAKVRRILGERRVGHAGTLDPMATGLLIVGVGPSTRLLRFAQSQRKRYTGVVTFGVSTDSLDADGEVLARSSVPALHGDDVNVVASSMLGPQTQIPPMVSALKVDGTRLHVLARRGVTVERDPRAIVIYELSLAPTSQPDQWSFEVTCSSGTYVRVLMSDLAERLGTLGHLSQLRRISSGAHEVHNALTLDELERRVADGGTVLRAPKEFVRDLDEVIVSSADEQRIRQGQRVALADAAGDEIAACDSSGRLVAVLERRSDVWQPQVVMPFDGDEHG
jgi:tRNA pseudouridine55 synthase